MADNYLEKKFEEHLNAPFRKASRPAPKVHQRLAVVVGGAGSIGSAVVRSLRVAGHKVFLLDASDDESAAAGRETALHTGATFKTLDNTDSDSLRKLLAEVAESNGDIEIVVCCPHDRRTTHITSLNDSDLASAIGNGIGALITSAQFMARQGSEENNAVKFGRLVSISHLEDGLAPSPRLIEELSECLTAKGVAVNAIAIERSEHGDCLPENIARAVRFFVDEANGFVNGKQITL